MTIMMTAATPSSTSPTNDAPPKESPPAEPDQVVVDIVDPPATGGGASGEPPPEADIICTPAGKQLISHDEDDENGEAAETESKQAHVGDWGPLEEVGGSQPSKPKAPKHDPDLVMLYEVWPSQNKFFCRGNCVTAKETETFSFVEACCDLLSLCFPCCSLCNPDAWITARDGADPVRIFSSAHICAWSSLVLPLIFFCLFTYLELWEAADEADGAFGMVVGVMALFFGWSAITFLLLASCSDPGIIPRREIILSCEGLREKLQAQLGYDLLNGADPDDCVGQRNYRYFMGFLWSVVSLGMLVIPSIIWSLVGGKPEGEHNQWWNDKRKEYPAWFFLVAILLATFAAVLAVLVGMLCGYHMYLSYRGITTKEHWRGTHDLKAKLRTVLDSPGPRLFNPRQRLSKNKWDAVNSW